MTTIPPYVPPRKGYKWVPSKDGPSVGRLGVSWDTWDRPEEPGWIYIGRLEPGESHSSQGVNLSYVGLVRFIQILEEVRADMETALNTPIEAEE